MKQRLTIAHRILWHLTETGEVERPGDIADAIGAKRSSVWPIIGRLAHHGHIRRHNRTYSITPRGIEKLGAELERIRSGLRRPHWRELPDGHIGEGRAYHRARGWTESAWSDQ